MRDEEIEDFRSRVHAGTVLERAGWIVDKEGSSRNAIRYRSGPGQIIVVTHEGKGWFDPLNNRRGDVLALVQHLHACNLGHARVILRPLAGIAPSLPSSPAPRVAPGALKAEPAWCAAAIPRPGSAGWRYLTEDRGIPADTVARAVAAGRLREGILGTMWGGHCDERAQMTGWEMRGPQYKGFSAGGRKGVFAIGEVHADRVVVTEAMIDALSIAATEGWRPSTAYLSTGGGFGPASRDALRVFVRPGAVLAAGTDRGAGGEILAERLAAIAVDRGALYERLAPPTAADWNDELRSRPTLRR